ncbi:MAG: lytic transglycosylase domain-containing protein [Thermoanaerobaculales bacterium]|nr:lytic transglycosylase domain-containing protein [Thermoanaerobaculales bacterium]
MTTPRARVLIRRALTPALCGAMLGACGGAPSPGRPDPRLEVLEGAFASRSSEPRRAAELFAAAGPGACLEGARLAAWHRALESFDAEAGLWRDLIDERPGADLTASATLALARALARQGELDDAIAVLTAAPESARHDADLALVELADPATAASAARSLALHAPAALRRHSRDVERTVLSGFDDSDWVVRSAAWRAAGHGSIGAAELRGRRFGGDAERARRLELARCELDAGSPARALGVLPIRARADAEELVVRAEAMRRRGWGRFPDPAAGAAFAECLDEARLAARSASGATLEGALILVLECGTESGELGDALNAWRALEAAFPNHERRSWLGRRLGVSLARTGADPEAVRGLASALPEHRRCLEYWQGASGEPARLEVLAAAPIDDLYGVWAARDLGVDGRGSEWVAAPATGGAEPGFAVAWLLDAAGIEEASQEWQRQLAARRPTAAEAVAAAALAARAGRPNTAIKTLLAGIPELASVGIAGVPVDAARAYLPLAWNEHIVAAASQTGLDPWLIAALARQESTFVADAVSPAGARGVLQLLPSTARSHALTLGLGGRPNLGDPAVNIRLGARELARLVRAFGAVEPALASYNAGEARVRSWQRRWPDPRLLAESLPIPETYTYVRRVVFLAEAYRQVHADAWKEGP